MDLSLSGLWASMGVPAKTIVFILAGMLVWSVAVFVERQLYFMRARKQSRDVAEAITGPLSKGNIDGAIKVAKDEQYKLSYLAVILRSGLAEFAERPDKHGLEAAKRVLERVTVTETGGLKRGFNILATTGSTAPFVGLVGTIFGIINAFSKMAGEGGADLTAISGGIAEALVSTAFGIGVAIAAIWVYNYFNAIIDDITKDISVSIMEFVEWAEKEVLRRSEVRAAK
jgi:biopolymer transport protein ExbB/biopolymer transport protein TolQ